MLLINPFVCNPLKHLVVNENDSSESESNGDDGESITKLLREWDRWYICQHHTYLFFTNYCYPPMCNPTHSTNWMVSDYTIIHTYHHRTIPSYHRGHTYQFPTYPAHHQFSYSRCFTNSFNPLVFETYFSNIFIKQHPTKLQKAEGKDLTAVDALERQINIENEKKRK